MHTSAVRVIWELFRLQTTEIFRQWTAQARGSGVYALVNVLPVAQATELEAESGF